MYTIVRYVENLFELLNFKNLKKRYLVVHFCNRNMRGF